MARLSDYQWLILWELNDHPASFWRRGDEWFWTAAGVNLKVTFQVRKLLERGLIAVSGTGYPDPLHVTWPGKQALLQRDYLDVVNRVNGDK